MADLGKPLQNRQRTKAPPDPKVSIEEADMKKLYGFRLDLDAINRRIAAIQA